MDTAVDVSARDAAVVAFALQHGVAPETIRHALLRNPDGSAAGPLGAVLDIAGRPVRSQAAKFFQGTCLKAGRVQHQVLCRRRMWDQYFRLSPKLL